MVLGPLTKGTPLRVANLIGEDQHGVDDAPHHRTDTARDKADDQLRDTQAGVAEVYPPDADEAESAKGAWKQRLASLKSFLESTDV